MSETDSKTARRSRRLGLSLRALMVLILVGGVLLGWKVNRARRQRRAVTAIEEAGGIVTYDHTFSGTYPYKRNGKPWGPEWLRRRIGDEYFQEVTAVWFGEKARNEGLAALKDLDRLLSLDVGRSPVTDAGLKTLADVKSLRILRLDEAPITDAGLEHLARLPRLERLDLDGIKGLADAGLAHLGRVRTLRELSLFGTGITGAGLTHLKSMIGLRKLNLGNTEVDDAGLKSLAGLTELRELWLGNVPISDEGLASLQELVHLEILSLGLDVNVGDPGLIYLTDMKQMRTLDLCGTMVTDAGLKHLAGMPQLRNLDLRSDEITDAGLVHLRGLRRLQRLDVSRTWVTQQGVDSLAKAIPAIRVSRQLFSLMAPTPARRIRRLREEIAQGEAYQEELKEWQKARDRGEDRPLPAPPL